MGSLPRLKIKDEIRYREGSTNESVNCRACRYFKRDFIQYRRQDMLVIEHRCALIGVRDGRRHRVREDYTCDRQQMSEEYKQYLKELSSLSSKYAEVF